MARNMQPTRRKQDGKVVVSGSPRGPHRISPSAVYHLYDIPFCVRVGDQARPG
jgi:hypothetical protein